MRGRIAGPQQNTRQRVESEATIQKHVAAGREAVEAELSELRGPIEELGEGVDANNDGILDTQATVGSLNTEVARINNDKIGNYADPLGSTPEKIRPYLTSLTNALGTNDPQTGVRGRVRALENIVGTPTNPATLVTRIFALEEQNANQANLIAALREDVNRLRGDVGDVGGASSLNAQVNELQNFRNRSGGFANKVAQSGSNNHRHV